MTRVTQDAPPVADEEAGIRSKTQKEQHERLSANRKYIIGLWLSLALIVLVLGLAVGLSQNNKKPKSTQAGAETKTASIDAGLNVDNFNADNLAIFDKAVALLEANPRRVELLPSGEEISYREYNKGQLHTLVMLPGFMADDTSFSILAALPEFSDHHIIAVNPRGWWGSTMVEPLYDHEDQADEVMDLLDSLGIEEAMCAGYSTGGGIAFYMALNYPDRVPAAFLVHSISLHGLVVNDETGMPVPMRNIRDVEEIADEMFPEEMDADAFVEFGKAYSTNPEGWPPSTHKLAGYAVESTKMPGKAAAMYANSRFNVTPIKTKYAAPSEVLGDLESKVIVIHSERDQFVQMAYTAQLAIADRWAPPGTLSYYDDGEGHMALFDNPVPLAKTYRRAFEEQVLTA